MLRAIESTALETRLQVVRIRDVMDATATRLREVLPGVYSKDLLEVLFSLPYCRIPFVQSSLGVSRPTASTYLRQLEEHGFVRGLKVGREMYFINDLLLKVLNPAITCKEFGKILTCFDDLSNFLTCFQDMST